MKTYVLDASVAAAAFFQEDSAERAQGLLDGRHVLCAPDLIHAELANVIWKRHKRGEIDGEEASHLLADFHRLSLRITPCGELAEAALELALRSSRSVYDCLYLALAVKCRSAVITADRRLVNALSGTPLAAHVTWLGDIR